MLCLKPKNIYKDSSAMQQSHCVAGESSCSCSLGVVMHVTANDCVCHQFRYKGTVTYHPFLTTIKSYLEGCLGTGHLTAVLASHGLLFINRPVLLYLPILCFSFSSHQQIVKICLMTINCREN